MKAFKFTLQSLLNVKLTLEKQQKAELAAAEARLRAFELELETLRAALAGEKDEYFRQAGQGGITPGELPQYAVGFRVMRERIAEQTHKIEVARGEKLRVQAKVVEIMKERKMLEKLKEKQLEEYRTAQRAEDSAAIGDFVSNKITREGEAS